MIYYELVKTFINTLHLEEIFLDMLLRHYSLLNSIVGDKDRVSTFAYFLHSHCWLRAHQSSSTRGETTTTILTKIIINLKHKFKNPKLYLGLNRLNTFQSHDGSLVCKPHIHQSTWSYYPLYKKETSKGYTQLYTA